ncbi:pRL-18 [Streptomyces sparsogenes DSM 40356]|uniref:PRL-18 n=2 Tax=Streptomyces sparsogenes TaxID=67365 RepID=A0A1R1S875_9ACTN|nr:pRL-18 [Streptomyces sparsogenes DSM 40356]
MWKGKLLPERRPVHEEIHYRLYDGRTGQLLSFSSTNSFNAIVADILATQREHPNARIVGAQVNGPAYT